MPTFDADTLRALRDAQEPTIRTDPHPNSAVVIWVVVEGDDVFVRSWLGARGRWYKDLAAGDANSVERASREILRKYRRSSHAQEMVRAEILPTTLRLEPR